MKESLLSRFDIYSNPYSFIFNNNHRVTSRFGGILSIISIILLCIIIILLIIEHVDNTSRTLNQYIKVSSLTEDIYVYKSFALQVGNMFGKSLSDLDRYFSFNVFYVSRTSDMNHSAITSEISLKLRRCTINDFLNEEVIQESFLYSILNNTLCVDDWNPNKIYTNQKENIFQYYKITVKPCINDTINGNFCYPFETIQNTIYNDNLFFSLNYLDYIISNSNNPMTTYLNNDIFEIKDKEQKNVEYHLSSNDFYIDKSYFIRSHDPMNFVTFKKQHQYSFSIHSENNNTSFINLYLLASNIKYMYYLTNPRILHVLAYLGGLVKLIMIICELIISVYTKRKAQEVILKKLYNVKRTQLNKNLLSTIATDKSTKGEKENLQSKIKLRLKLNINDNKIQQVSQDESNINHLQKAENINVNTSNNILLINNNDLRINKKPIEFSMDEIHISKLEEKEVTNVIRYIFQRNNNCSNIEENNSNLFTACENLLIMFCSCFIFKKLWNRNEVFMRLFMYSTKYLDTLNIIKTVCEFEKLKFVVFDEKQLSLFNVLSKPRNPLEVIENEIKFSTFNQENPFTYEKANAFLIELKNRKNLSRVDKKLLELVNK